MVELVLAETRRWGMGLNVAWTGSALGSNVPASSRSESTSRSHAPLARREGQSRAQSPIVSRSTAGPAHVPGELDAAIHQLGVIPVASVLSGLLTQTIGIRWLIRDFRGGSLRHVRHPAPLLRDSKGLILETPAYNGKTVFGTRGMR